MFLNALYFKEVLSYFNIHSKKVGLWIKIHFDFLQFRWVSEE